MHHVSCSNAGIQNPRESVATAPKIWTTKSIQRIKRKSEVIRWLFSSIAFQAKRFVPF